MPISYENKMGSDATPQVLFLLRQSDGTEFYFYISLFIFKSQLTATRNSNFLFLFDVVSSS